MTSIGDIVYIYWPVAMALFVVGIGCIYDAPAAAKTDEIWPIPFDFEQAPNLLQSPILWVSMGSMFAGLLMAHKASQSYGYEFTRTERMAMTWHICNATFYHTFCDSFSGLFGMTPNLSESYKIQNYIHKQPRHHPDRIGWDTIYWFELLFETPMAIWVAYLYMRQSKARYTVEAFLHGCHFAGAVAYYVPDLILGHTPHMLISNLDRLIACAWVVVPFCLLARTINLVANDQVKSGVPIPAGKKVS